MNTSFSSHCLLATAAAAALLLGSCAYDPYYTNVSYGQTSGYGHSGYGQGGYGYGHGHGYGGSTFSTSILISTGNPRWGYDPYSYAYYDYNRRAYYDPYLYAYYPVGYRPPVVIGVPHPHGWRRGRTMPPPNRIRNTTLSNYRDRESAYRQTDHSWARQVRTDRSSFNDDPRRGSSVRQQEARPTGRATGRPGDPSAGSWQRPQEQPQFNQPNPGRGQGRNQFQQQSQPATRSGAGADQSWQDGAARGGRSVSPGVPAAYNRPIATQSAVQEAPARPDRGSYQPSAARPPETRPVPQQAPAQQSERRTGRSRAESVGGQPAFETPANSRGPRGGR